MQPLTVVSIGTTTYCAAFTILQKFRSEKHIDFNLNSIHDVHSVLTTAAAVYALSRKWSISDDHPLKAEPANDRLDDRRNPLIMGKSRLGNFITAWETSYLLFDTFAKLDLKLPVHTAWLAMARSRPLTLFHHLALLGALGVLQVYIARDRERGVWIIVALMLMNASTPVLHWRWRQRQRLGSRGKTTLTADACLAVAFAACRMGLVAWVLRKYGDFHGIGAWGALVAQRAICQVGTGLLVAVNGVWWLILVKNMAKKLRSSSLLRRELHR